MAARIWNKLIEIQEVAWMPQIDLHQEGLASQPRPKGQHPSQKLNPGQAWTEFRTVYEYQAGKNIFILRRDPVSQVGKFEHFLSV